MPVGDLMTCICEQILKTAQIKIAKKLFKSAL